MQTKPFELAGVEVQPGTRASIQVPVSQRYVSGEVSLPVCVIHGRRAGPTLFVSAAIHGDEINGVEIIRRLLKRSGLGKLHGTLIAVPVVNVYGFIAHTRYLPDRRDLNRSFPGSTTGSLAARLAGTFMTEIVKKATHGIDLHTGSLHRANLPQIRANLESEECSELAQSFGAPVIINSPLRPGSLRQAMTNLGIPIIVYEAGEALRFDELSIKGGVAGVLSVMRSIGMLPAKVTKRRKVEPFVAHGSMWVRAPDSGILVSKVPLGASVTKGELLGTVSDLLGGDESEVYSPTDGIMIGRANLPLVNEGDALFHIAVFEHIDPVSAEVDFFQEAHDIDS